MIRTVRIFFLGRLLREKLLLLAFILIGVLMWLSSFNKRATVFWRAQQVTGGELAFQQQVLGNQKQIEDYIKATTAKLDSSQTLNNSALFAEVDRLAKAAGFANAPVSPGAADKTNGQFSIHSVSIKIDRADFMSLRSFYLSLQKRSPYLSVQQVTLRPADRNNPLKDSLNAAFEISSFEIEHK